MNNLFNQLNNDLVNFKKHHKNIYNIYFHIICGLIFIPSLFLIFKKYSIILLLIYYLLIIFTINNKIVSTIILILVYIMLLILNSLNLSTNKLGLIFILFYFLPELSHFLTKEATVLQMNNITILSIFINILYLLPFSILSLFNTN